MTTVATLQLAQFQQAFAHALRVPSDSGDPMPSPIADLLGQPGFAVYRNTVIKGSIDALEANFPTVATLVGIEWFRSAAAIFVDASPPKEASLIHYGAGFADFLAEFIAGLDAAVDLAYLPGVAQLDRCWTEAHVARDEPVIDTALLASVPASDLAHMVLQPHAAARWRWFAQVPVFEIWQRSRAGADLSDIDWLGGGGLLTRPHHDVIWTPLSESGCAFLSACSQGRPLNEAAGAAMDVAIETDLTQLMATLLKAGAFRATHPASAHS